MQKTEKPKAVSKEEERRMNSGIDLLFFTSLPCQCVCELPGFG